MKLKLKCKLLITALVFLVPATLIAQAGPPAPPADVPIDGGLSLALAAGAGYLVKRRHDAKKKNAQRDREILP